MTIQQHLEKLSQLSEQLQPWHGRFNEIQDILNLRKPLLEQVERFNQDEQTLNIAIMGQVKAGKSSFLNALLFNGKPVLPTAATPKTANLTRISYGEKPVLEVEYYTAEEWQDLEQLAQQQGDYDQIKVAKELTTMVKQSGLDVTEVLQQQKQLIEANSLDELMQVLDTYAGNSGQYTPLVKMTRLYLPNEELKGFDIIDTPGMNDPVLSRTEKTKEEMKRCDVVFFLSRASQFLDQSDIELLSSQLPQGGVQKMVLVAAQYDSVIIDDGFNRDSLAECETNVQKRVNRRAETELGKLAEQREQAGRPQVAELLRSLTKPILSSTFAYGFAHWEQSQWDNAMQHTYKELQSLGEEWNDYQFTAADWERIGNFKTLSQEYEQARQNKVQLLEQKKQELLPKAQENLTDKVQALNAMIDQRIHTLNTQDIQQLEQQQKKCEQQIQRISGKLENLINEQINKLQSTTQDITSDLQKGIQQYSRITTHTGTETEERSYEVSTSKWYNPFSWGSTETRYRSYTTTYEYLNASDAVEQVSQYARECKSDIQLNFNNLVRPNQLKLDLRKALVDELNTSSQDFDPKQFKNTLDRVINQLDLPELNLDIGNPSELISRNFSGQVRSSSDIQQLKQQLNQSLQKIFEMLSQRFKASSQDLERSLEQTRNSLLQTLIAGLEQELQQVRQDFAEKQKTLEEYQQLKKILA
ncbi:dynamin family protein [Acinetobacter modestus]|uniref:dynamin family protein n=1 Tax=Acinetobacter modestus TaxID=1776740 RepID=UPI00202F8F4F|nr:dynamin family protein [Acinetobacter modestus]MCM1958312.1 dynamin family protein [Acinetobacter modestus]